MRKSLCLEALKPLAVIIAQSIFNLCLASVLDSRVSILLNDNSLFRVAVRIHGRGGKVMQDNVLGLPCA